MKKINNSLKFSIFIITFATLLNMVTLDQHSYGVSNEFLINSSKISPYITTAKLDYEIATLNLDINMDLFNQGSFRSIKGYNNSYVYTLSDNCDSYIDGSKTCVWSPTGFPTTEIYYASVGAIVIEIDNKDKNYISEKLAKYGFKSSITKGNKTIFRKGFSLTGIIKLYPYK